MSYLIQELPIYIMLVNHLNNPATGKSHEEGGRVLASQFTGARGQWRYSTDMWGFERDLLSEDQDVKNTMTLRILKHRTDGNKTGKILKLKYNVDTGRQEEPDAFSNVAPTGVPDLAPDPVKTKVTAPPPPAQTLGNLLGDDDAT